MRLWIDAYAHRESVIHRWEPRAKLVTLLAVIFAFSLVRDLRWVPAMVALTAALYAAARLPVSFLVTRLRYPGYFLLIMGLFLPFFAGETVLVRLGPLALHEEGLLQFALIAARFGCILTVGLVLFGTAPFLTTIDAMRRLGLPDLLADMTLLAFRYLFEIGDSLARMETAMRLRGFRMARLGWRSLQILAALAGSLLVRSFEQSERVYNAMRLRGYGRRRGGDDERGGDQVCLSGDHARRNGGSPGDGSSAAGRPAAPVLAVADLTFDYPDRPDVLTDLNFSVRPGERVGLIGPNGAGKTSLFLVIAGVLKPAAGAVHVSGRPVQPGTFHPEIGLVFQNADDQLFSPSVRDDVAFGPLNMGLPADEVRRRVDEALALAGMADLADRPPHHLSGGEKRMVAIAGVLAMHPQLVLYDEPDANLDVRARRRLIRFLQNAAGTLLIASHDLELILEVCDRLILLDEGRLVADGDSRLILGDAALMEAHGLEKPHSLVPHVHGSRPAADPFPESEAARRFSA